LPRTDEEEENFFRFNTWKKKGFVGFDRTAPFGETPWELTRQDRIDLGLIPKTRTKKEMPIEGFDRAMTEYAYLVLIDPTNFPEAAGWAGALGVSYRIGMAITLIKGLAILPIITAIDPQHRWEGGLDETSIYQSIESDIKFGVDLGWAASPANPRNW